MTKLEVVTLKALNPPMGPYVQHGHLAEVIGSATGATPGTVVATLRDLHEMGFADRKPYRTGIFQYRRTQKGQGWIESNDAAREAQDVSNRA